MRQTGRMPRSAPAAQSLHGHGGGGREGVVVVRRVHGGVTVISEGGVTHDRLLMQVHTHTHTQPHSHSHSHSHSHTHTHHWGRYIDRLLMQVHTHTHTHSPLGETHDRLLVQVHTHTHTRTHTHTHNTQLGELH